jgi:hypothetical protein
MLKSLNNCSVKSLETTTYDPEYRFSGQLYLWIVFRSYVLKYGCLLGIKLQSHEIIDRMLEKHITKIAVNKANTMKIQPF